MNEEKQGASTHQCFTVSPTAYLRSIDFGKQCFAVHYQRPPRETEDGQCIGLRFPLLIVSGYVENPDHVAEKVAAILNQHWVDQ